MPSPEVTEVLDYLDAAIREREQLLVRGGLAGEGIELSVNYKAAVSEIINLKRIRARVDEVFNKKQKAEQDDSGLQPLPE